MPDKENWFQRFLNIQTSQPVMPGVATSAAAFNRDIPRAESTVGNDLAYTGALLASPLMGTSFAKNMVIGLPAFEVFDRLPTLIGQDRATVQGGNLLEKGFRAISPDGRFENAVAPYVNQAGQVIAGLPVGGFGELFSRRAASGIAGALDRAAQKKAASQLGYLQPVSESLAEHPARTFEFRGQDYDIDEAADLIYDQTGTRTPIITEGPGANVAHRIPNEPRPGFEWEDFERINAEPNELVGNELLEFNAGERRMPRRLTADERQRLFAEHPEMEQELRAAQDNPVELQVQMEQLANMTPEQIAHEQAILADVAKGNRAVPETMLREAPKPIVEAPLANGYSIERYPGYQLKMLMAGNPLEKQIGKNGTVNINNINALKQKASKVEQAVIDKVLASDEFAGQKSIDYNKFRKAVQDELITYDRTPDTRWEDYGMNRIGLVSEETDFTMPLVNGPQREIMSDFIKDTGSEWRINYRNTHPVFVDKSNKVIPKSDVDKYYVKWLNEKGIDYVEANGTTPETFTFSSSRIPQGSSKHYDANTLGHSRTYTTAEEPDVLHVMESQSDWAQSGKAASRSEIENQIASLKQSLAMQEENLKNNGRYFAQKVKNDVEGNIDYLKEKIEEYNSRLKDAAQSGYLRDNYTSRQIQENLRYAAEKGQKKMRYPTRETAAKIEGYPERINYFDKNGFRVKEPYEYPEDVAKRIESIQNEIDKIDIDDLDTFAPFDIREGSFAWGSNSGEVTNAKLLAKLRDRILRDRDSLYQMRKYGDDNDMVTERLYNNEKLFDKQVAKYKEKYGHEPELDVYSSKSREAKARRNILEPELKELLGSGPTQLKKGLIEKKEYDYEDILRKYTEFPKQYKKLFKGADVRTVTDPKGNTWYEVDVPEGYLQQEWAYKYGGLISRLNKHYGSNSKALEVVRRFAEGRKFDMGGPEEPVSYATLLQNYQDAVAAKNKAYKEYDASKKAFYDAQDALPASVQNSPNYAWYKIPSIKRLGDKSDEDWENVLKSSENYIAAQKAIGAATVEKYRGTEADLLQYDDWSSSEEGAIKYLTNDGVRESVGAQEVADYFNSYAASPGFQRIINNQSEWGQKRHPYRRLYDSNYTKRGFVRDVERMRETLLKNPMESYGVFDMDAIPGMGFNYTQYATEKYPYAHIIVNSSGNPFLNQQDERYPYWDELTHEMLHDYNFVGTGQGEALDQNTNAAPGHDSRRNEKHSDLEALRFMLYKYGIYDSRGEKDATAEDIKKLREMFPKLRQFEQMDDETAAWMINHVADANDAVDMSNVAARGGKIHIKPENRGKFTALKKRTGKSASWFKAHGTPAQKKMAVFELNAKKWRHDDGGLLDIDDMYVTVESPEFVGPVLPVENENMIDAQRYAESNYRDNAYNRGSKATGAYQITPVVLKEYTKRTGIIPNLYDLEQNRAVRDWYMNVRLPEFEMYSMGAPSDSNRVGRTYAAFNAGPGAVRKALKQAEAAGENINQGFGFLQYLPQETQDYVNFIVRGKDIPGTSKTKKKYDKAKARKKADGGTLERLSAHANGDTRKMIELIRKARGAN